MKLKISVLIPASYILSAQKTHMANGDHIGLYTYRMSHLSQKVLLKSAGLVVHH